MHRLMCGGLSLRLEQIAALTGGVLSGPADLEITEVVGHESATNTSLTFAEDGKSLKLAEASPALAVLRKPDSEGNKPAVLVDEPRIAFAKVLGALHPRRLRPPGIHPTATVLGKVSPEAYVGPFCVIEAGAVVGPGCELVARVHLQAEATLGPDCWVAAGVTLGPKASVGAGSYLDARCRLAGGVSLGKSSYLGAAGILEEMAILGDNCILDNMILVESQAQLGAHCVMVAKTSVRKQATLGPYCVLGGKAVVQPGSKLGAAVRLAGKSVARGQIEKAGDYLGDPARPLREVMRERALARRRTRESD